MGRRKSPAIRNPFPKPIPRGRIAREAETPRQKVMQKAGAYGGVQLRRDERKKPGPKPRTEEQKKEIVMARKADYARRGVGRKPKEGKVDPPAEKGASCAVRKHPKVIKADDETGEKILEALKKSLDENPELSRKATAHFENILENMSYSKWDHTRRKGQLQRALNKLKTQKPEFKDKFDNILPPTSQTISSRQRFESALLDKVHHRMKAIKREILKKIGHDEKLKKWWMQLVKWDELLTAEDEEPCEEDRAFRRQLSELAKCTRLLGGQATASDQNKKLYDRTMKKALDLLSKYHFIILSSPIK